MLSELPTYFIFVDYDNLTEIQKTKGILDIITKILFQINFNTNQKGIKFEIRLYGGWYEGNCMTKNAHDLFSIISRDFPHQLTIPDKDIKIFLTAELVCSLVQDPANHIFNTFRKRETPGSVRVLAPDDVGCNDSDCILISLKRIIRTGRCPRKKCTINTRNLVYRHEQKSIDSMLTCDIIHCASFSSMLVLVSSDDDFIPPLKIASMNGAAVYRFHTKNNSYRNSLPSHMEKIIEKELL